ncbi:MAG TPA: NUDIX hydrolase [Candidatus Cybelea sp.]|nr:NUDIX hydrolase [Candidatus Cybelea sp.]
MPVPHPSDYAFALEVPEGDNRERFICRDCGWIHYVNPKVVVGAVCVWDDKILLCKRAIEPRLGYWTIPAGFLEERESSEQGAIREAQEEASADIALDGLLAVYNIPRISQVQIIYRARLRSPSVAAGVESAAVRLYDWSDIPWNELAFPSVRWALDHYRETMGHREFSARTNPADETVSR